MLRLIAGIAQCGFDDLKRRDLARRRRIAVGALIVAAIVIALVVSALIFASESRRNAQIEESRRLAAESTQLLALGDRYGAIECALEALPESTGSNDRPYIPEARAALENALELNASEDSVWRPSYEITTQAPLGLVDSSFAHGADDDVVLASSIAVSDEGGFFAVSDSAGNICVYDTLTGKKLVDCAMPSDAAPLEDGLYARTMAATEGYLVVSNGGESSAISCFDAGTGEMVWSYDDAGSPSFDTSYGGNYISMSAPLQSGGYAVSIADLENGASSGIAVEGIGLLDASSGYFNTPRILSSATSYAVATRFTY